MELRRLSSDEERRTFALRMAEARAKHGIGFTETPRSLLGQIHLAFGELYSLYECEDDPVERMMSGFAMHDLGAMPQSYPKPDLTHLPPERVLECGELWSFSKGAGLLARRACSILAGLRQIQAFLVYPISRPWDGTGTYTESGFIKPCGPVEFPYGQTLDGTKIWVQPMVIEGETLQSLIRKVFELGFETADRHHIIRFPNPLALKPSLDRPSIPLPGASTSASISTIGRPADSGGEVQVNGAAGA
jgi:hypothetical protein